MKVLFISMAIVAVAMGGEAPYPASGWKPNGALLVVPARQQEVTSSPPVLYGPSTTQQSPPQNTTEDAQDEASDPEQVSEDAMERLRQQEGSQTGEFYVLLPEGRLQKIRFATAPLKGAAKSEKVQQAPQYSGQYSRLRGQENAAPAPGSEPASPRVYAVRPPPAASAAPEETQKGEAEGEPEETEELRRAAAQFGQIQLLMAAPAGGYVASVQYTDVEPVGAPIFTYSSAPLVRILRSP